MVLWHGSSGKVATGEIWAVELDDEGKVSGSCGPLYVGDYASDHEVDFTDEDVPVFETLDSDWLEEHRDDFVLFADESEM